jgi:uncharacterized protein (DUF2384 family)
MTSQAVARLHRAMEQTSLGVPSVARILGRDPKTVARWLRAETDPRWEAHELVLSLYVVLEKLAQIVEPEAAQDWLFTPVPAFDYQRPADLLREGNYRPVLAAIDAIGEGVFT